jgi:hypothetical protein
MPSSVAKLYKIVYQRLVTVYTLGGLFSYTLDSVYVANFREFYKGEVRRISIPRTSVNKGRRRGRDV